MNPLDDRLQTLLDSEEHEGSLRADLAAEAGQAERDRALLEGAIRALRRPVEPLPADFEARVMARVAARPRPQPGRSWAGFLEHLAAVPAWGRLAGAAAALALVAAVSAWAGFRAGQSSQSSPVAATERKVVVRFALAAPDARRVELAGTFNGWGAQGIALARGADGGWTATLELPRGRYEYTFVVDGQRWLPDATAESVEDGFGGRNAVIDI